MVAALLPPGVAARDGNDDDGGSGAGAQDASKSCCSRVLRNKICTPFPASGGAAAATVAQASELLGCGLAPGAGPGPLAMEAAAAAFATCWLLLPLLEPGPLLEAAAVGLDGTALRAAALLLTGAEGSFDAAVVEAVEAAGPATIAALAGTGARPNPKLMSETCRAAAFGFVSSRRMRTEAGTMEVSTCTH